MTEQDLKYQDLKREHEALKEENQRLRVSNSLLEKDLKAQKDHIADSNKKVVTNADRIRNMSDDELSSFLGKTVYYCRGRQDQKYCDACPLYKCGACNEIYIERWLKDKVE